MINSYSAAAAASRPLLGVRDRVMLVGESRGLYWSVPFLNHSAYDVQAFEEALRDRTTAGAVVRRFRQLGVTHLFVNDRETSRLKFRYRYTMLVFTLRERALINDLWGHWVAPRLEGAQHTYLYRVLRVPVPFTGTRQPLTFDETALRNQFEGYATITWQGEGKIQLTKKMFQ
jgi:hypothetical protein